VSKPGSLLARCILPMRNRHERPVSLPCQILVVKANCERPLPCGRKRLRVAGGCEPSGHAIRPFPVRRDSDCFRTRRSQPALARVQGDELAWRQHSPRGLDSSTIYTRSLSRGAGCRYRVADDILNRGHPAGGNTIYAARPSNKRPLRSRHRLTTGNRQRFPEGEAEQYHLRDFGRYAGRL
jgi:hypothetical protein